MKTLKNRLKENIQTCYLLEGDDLFLFDKAISMIKKACQLQFEDFNFAHFDDENFSIRALLDSCEVLPMGDTKRVILLSNISKISENDKKLLQKYLSSPLSSTCLIIKDLDGVFSSLKNMCEFVDCNRMDRKLATAVIVSELSKQGKQISGEACQTLLDFCNGFLTNVMSQLDKLVFFDSTDPLVTKKIVETTINKTSEFSVFELTEALGQKKCDRVIELTNAMEKEPAILSLISNHFRRLFFIAISDMENADLAKLFGVKEYAVSKARTQVKNFSKLQLKKIYALLEQVDFMIKSGQMLAQNALYFLVFSILYI